MNKKSLINHIHKFWTKNYAFKVVNEILENGHNFTVIFTIKTIIIFQIVRTIIQFIWDIKDYFKRVVFGK